MHAAERLLRVSQTMRDEDYQAAPRRSAAADGAILALGFGATQTMGPWKAVPANAAYSAEAGFGWIPGTDDSEPTPEEIYYAMGPRPARGEESSTAYPDILGSAQTAS